MPTLQKAVLLLSALATASVATPAEAGPYPTDTLRVVARRQESESTPGVASVAGQTIREKPTDKDTAAWVPPTLTVYTSVSVPTGRPNAKTSASCRRGPDKAVLRYQKTEPGRAIKGGIKLRILGVGDSITAGYGKKDDTDWNGYREQLGKDLSRFPGKTIKYIADHVGPSLKHRPNIILLAAGTNDMNSGNGTATEGNDPTQASQRLGRLIDKMTEECPDAVILVLIILNTCELPDWHDQHERTKQFQKLIPGIVREQRQQGKHVVTVDFSTWNTSGGKLDDCVHPSDQGYDLMGDWWYSFVTQIDEDWINAPQGADPVRGNN